MERRFRCTACGKCCFGRLPLTIAEAVAHAGRFPLGVVWTPVRQGHKSYATTARLGAEIRLPDRRRLAVRIAPAAHVPPAFPCPALGGDGLCTIHEAKPLRCRAMPFLAWRDEADQTELLIPRPGWACDTSAGAPVVYRDKRVVERAGFAAERAELEAQAPLLRRYAEQMAATVPGLVDALAGVRPGGEVLLSFATLLLRLDGVDRGAVATAQLPVLAGFAARAEGRPELAEFHHRYSEWMGDMDRAMRRFRSA